MLPDSFTILFEEALDAVKFCLHAQLMLAEHKWPKGLMSEEEFLPLGDDDRERSSSIMHQLHMGSALKSSGG